MSVVTIGANTYDAFGDIAGANEYLAARIGADSWAAASAATKGQALVSATRSIQAWAKRQVGITLDPAASVDALVTQATYELAYLLTQDAELLDAVNTTTNERRLKAGPAEVEYFRPVRGGRYPQSVQILLNNWLTSTGAYASLVSGAAYGTDNVTTLQPNDYLVVGTSGPITDETEAA